VTLPALFSSFSFSRPTWAQIHLPSLRANARVLRGAANTPLIAVIKADAYGHGAIQAAEALQYEAFHFAVAGLDEGRILREAGITKPILALSAILPAQADYAVEYDLTVSVNSLEVAHALDKAAAARKKIANVHWKFDTGMGRVGVWHEEALAMWQALQQLECVAVKGVFTHFASADEPDEAYTLQQINIFEQVLEQCGITIAEYMVHAANSPAALRFPQARYSAIRCGLSLYGASPFGNRQYGEVLAPVMSLQARIVDVRRIAKGRTVSYGGTWKAERDSILALVPLGYADGYPRSLSNRGEVLIKGKRCRVAGRVTMDQILVDVTEISANIQPGEIVTAWGLDENGVYLPVEEVAAKANTIAYEMLTGITARVPRVYNDILKS
jgi:alanine racemase